MCDFHVFLSQKWWENEPSLREYPKTFQLIRFAIVSLLLYWKTEQICDPFKSFSATHLLPLRKYIPTLPIQGSKKFMENSTQSRTILLKSETAKMTMLVLVKILQNFTDLFVQAYLWCQKTASSLIADNRNTISIQSIITLWFCYFSQAINGRNISQFHQVAQNISL